MTRRTPRAGVDRGRRRTGAHACRFRRTDAAATAASTECRFSPPQAPLHPGAHASTRRQAPQRTRQPHRHAKHANGPGIPRSTPAANRVPWVRDTACGLRLQPDHPRARQIWKSGRQDARDGYYGIGLFETGDHLTQFCRQSHGSRGDVLFLIRPSATARGRQRVGVGPHGFVNDPGSDCRCTRRRPSRRRRRRCRARRSAPTTIRFPRGRLRSPIRRPT